MTMKDSEAYRLYIDESGDHVMEDETTLVRESHRYLALVGCWIAPDVYPAFHLDLEALKMKHFPHNPDEPVVLHRKDIVDRHRLFWRLRDDKKREEFDNDLIELFSRTPFTVFGAIVDKLAHKHQYLHPIHPYHMALNFLLQRYCGYLNHMSRRGDVMAESRGGLEDKELKSAFAYIWENGDMYHPSDFYQRALTSKELKLKRKHENIAGLQMVDLLAHPVRRYVLVCHQATSEEPTDFERRMFKILEGKFNRHSYTGKVEGYGWVLFPRGAK